MSQSLRAIVPGRLWQSVNTQASILTTEHFWLDDCHGERLNSYTVLN